jgi:hypothetical protein
MPTGGNMKKGGNDHKTRKREYKTVQLNVRKMGGGGLVAN